MGNTFFCKRCDMDKFELSRACADHILEENPEGPQSEERWIKKLRCLDNLHSKQFGLTEENFNDEIDCLYDYLKSNDIPVFCENRNSLLQCLKVNPNCMLNCTREMDDFIDCVDTLRVKRIKERIQESLKKKKRVTAF